MSEVEGLIGEDGLVSACPGMSTSVNGGLVDDRSGLSTAQDEILRAE